MSAKVGSVVTFIIGLADAGSLKRLSNQAVAFEVFVPEIGEFAPIATATTGPDGTASFEFQMPSTKDNLRFRAAWEGNEQYEADTSPEVKVKVVP